MILKLIVACVAILIVSCLVGLNFSKENTTLGEAVAYGFASILGGMEVIALICIYFKTTFTMFWAVSLFLCLLSALYGTLRNHPLILPMVKKSISSHRDIYFLGFLVLLFGQMMIWQIGYHSDEDDAFYVAAATTAIDTNTMFEYDAYTGEAYEELPARYVLSPFPMFTAFVGKSFGLRPIVVAHTLFPVIVLLMAYISVWLFAGVFFKKEEERHMVLFLASVLNIFSYYTARYVGARLILRPWQGKTILASVILPLVLYFMLTYGRQKALKFQEWLLLFMLMLGASFVSSMGIALSAVMLGCLLLTYFILNKNVVLLLQGVACCLPAGALSIIYVLIR